MRALSRRCAEDKDMGYIITLVALIATYVFVVFLMKYFTNSFVTTLILSVICFACYAATVWIVYSDVGLYDWNFRNTLPTANVSPFMFCTLPLFSVLPKRIKKYWSALIALLSFGMFVAFVLACAFRAIIHYKFHAHFLLDYVSHLALSLLGVYLVRSKQVELGKTECLIGSGSIVFVAFTMLILNVVLGTAFFGLSLKGDYNIYNMVIVSNAYLSAALYFIGLVAVLTAGYFYVNLLRKKVF